MPLKQLSRVAMLSALCITLRYAFSSLPNVQPITAIFLNIVIIFGLLEGILVATVTMLVSSVLLMFGPWVLWQIISFSLVLLLWKFCFYPLAKTNWLAQMLLAGVVAFSYGIIIDSISALFYGTSIWSYVLAGSVFNLAHALSTILCYPIITTIFRRFKNEKII